MIGFKPHCGWIIYSKFYFNSLKGKYEVDT